jgi:hypothetical protein
MALAGINRAEGQVVTTVAAADRILIQQKQSSGQYLPRQVTYANLITGGGTGFTAGSVIFTGASGDFDQDNTNFFFNDSTNTLRITNIDAGASGTAGTIDIFPTTASKGKIALAATANTNDDTLTITNAAQAAARTYTIPDAGASAAFMMTQGAQTVVGAQTFSAVATHNANIVLATAGNGLQIKEGSNARMGSSTLVNGTVTVSNTSVTANTRIFLNRYSPAASTALGVLSVGTVVANTSFVIDARKVADATVETNDVSVIHWILVEPAA